MARKLVIGGCVGVAAVMMVTVWIVGEILLIRFQMVVYLKSQKVKEVMASALQCGLVLVTEI